MKPSQKFDVPARSGLDEDKRSVTDPMPNRPIPLRPGLSMFRQQILQKRIICNLELAVLNMGLLGYGAEKEDLEMILHRVREEWDR